MARFSFFQWLMLPVRKIRDSLGEIFLSKEMEIVCVWKVGVPFILLLLAPALTFLIVRQPDHPLHRAFAHGDLLIFSSLILIEAGIELGRSKLKYSELLRGLATIMILLFGFVQIGAILREGELQNNDPTALTMLAGYSMFNLSVALASIFGSMYAFLHSVRKHNADRARNLA